MVKELQALLSVADSLKRQGELGRAEVMERKLFLVASSGKEVDWRTVGDLAVRLTLTLNLMGKFAEAEPIARKGLMLRERHYPAGCWQVESARSALGGSLVGLGQHTEARDLLLKAFEGLSANVDAIPAGYRIRISETVHYLVKLNEAIGDHAKAAEWRVKADQIFPADAT